jgi:hypothetical protein
VLDQRQIPGIGGLEPSPEADPGRGDDEVDRPGHHLTRRRHEFRIVGERHDPDRRRVDDPGAAAVEERAELLLAAGGRDGDRVAGQRLEGGLRIGLGHTPMVRPPCSGRVTSA